MVNKAVASHRSEQVPPETNFILNRGQIFSWYDLPERLMRRLLDQGDDEFDFLRTAMQVFSAANQTELQDSSTALKRPCSRGKSSSCGAIAMASVELLSPPDKRPDDTSPDVRMSINVSCPNALVCNKRFRANQPAPVELSQLGKACQLQPYEGKGWFSQGCFLEMRAVAARIIGLMEEEVTKIEESV